MKISSRPLALGASLLLFSGCSFAVPAAPIPIAGGANATVHPALTDFPLSKAPYLAAYHWGAANPGGGAKANEAFARWINRKTVWAEDFEAKDSWENNISGGGWQLGEWKAWKQADPSRRLILSVPLLPGNWDRSGPTRGSGVGTPVSFEAGAKGDYNAHFKELAQTLVQYGLGDSVLRLGWEFNGGWYTWRIDDDPQAFTAYWRQIVTEMRKVKGAEKLQICWNPTVGWEKFGRDQTYPGDEFVDIIGLDVYDDSWAKDSYPLPKDATPEEVEQRRANAWNNMTYGTDWGLKAWSDFARAHGKLFALPEWGVSRRQDGHGGLDNVGFVERMHKFINDPANNVYFDCYFDVQAPDGAHQLTSGIGEDEGIEFPQSAARFRTLFGQQDVAIPGVGTGLSATFFSDKTLSKPVATAQLLTANFDFKTPTSPDAKPVTAPPLHLAGGALGGVRFGGEIQALEGGTYRFAVPANSSARLWINDKMVLDAAKGASMGSIDLVAGQRYPLKGEIVGAGSAKLRWMRPGKSALETIPQTQLYPAMNDGTGLKASYFNGDNFDTLATSRVDPKVDFWWGRSVPANTDGTPIKGIGAEHFSIRWTGQVEALESGTYSFTTNTDDGARLWVNGKLILDHFVGQSLTSYSGTIDLEAGHKYDIKMEYFQGTGDAVAKLLWTRPGHLNAQTVPQSQLFPAS